MSKKQDSKSANRRLKSSPYAGSIINLTFNTGPAISIPAAVLKKCPVLSKRCTQWVDNALDVSHETGHVVVHYLFTGTYQALRSKGASSAKKNLAEFTTSVNAYVAAQNFKLPELVELAKVEITKLGDKLHTLQVINAVTDAHPNPRAEDAWFSDYLKSRMKLLYDSGIQDSDLSDGNTISIQNVLLKSMIELHLEQMQSLQHTLATKPISSETCESEVGSQPILTPQSEPEPLVGPEVEAWDLEPIQVLENGFDPVLWAEHEPVEMGPERDESSGTASAPPGGPEVMLKELLQILNQKNKARLRLKLRCIYWRCRLREQHNSCRGGRKECEGCRPLVESLLQNFRTEFLTLTELATKIDSR